MTFKMYKVLRTSLLSFYLKILQEKYNTLWNGIGIEINTLQGERNKTLLESADLVWLGFTDIQQKNHCNFIEESCSLQGSLRLKKSL